MRPVILLFIFIFLALLVSGLLSYPLYQLLNNFFDVRFDKLISHLASITGLVFMFLFLKFYKVLDRDTAGFASCPAPFSQEFLPGIVIGVFIMVFLEIILLVLGIRIPASELGINVALIVFVGKVIISGIAVALIEETLYRGALLGGLLRKSGMLTAIIISSLVYAAVHFIRFPGLDEFAGSGLTTGFLILSGLFAHSPDPDIIGSLLSLAVFGVFLALVRLQRGNIYQCMGIHAGVVMSIKIITKLTDYNQNSKLGFLVSSYDHHIGYLALVWLAVLTLIYYRYGINHLLKQPGRLTE